MLAYGAFVIVDVGGLDQHGLSAVRAVEGQFFLIGNVIENQFITVGEWNFGSAISMIMAVIMMLCMYLIRRVDEHNSGGRKKKA